jgi:hypothetical protein
MTPRTPCCDAANAAGAGGRRHVGSCATRQPETLVLKTYHETLSSLLLSQDRQHLVVIGEHHHYIFDTPRPWWRPWNRLCTPGWRVSWAASPSRPMAGPRATTP